MPSTLVFPDGVRLARKGELAGPEDARSKAWARIQSANIQPGFVLSKSKDKRFRYYAEANVDAPKIWPVFRDLCQALLASEATLVFSEIDDDPRPLRSAPLGDILAALARYEYQLVHDGYVQFGIICEDAGRLNEVFVAPTKDLKIWLNDHDRFRSVMSSFGIPEAHRLDFLDEYPRTTLKLPPTTGAFHYTADLAKRLETEIDAPRDD